MLVEEGDSMHLPRVERIHRITIGACVSLALASTSNAQHVIDQWHGELTSDQFGKSLAMLGDVDGDGVCDVAVGSVHTAGSNEGAVYLYSGASGTLIRRIDGVQNQEFFGCALAPLNDVDGDGVPDLAIGAFGWFEPGGWDGGRVCVYSGATGSLVWYQPSQGRQCGLGASIAKLGDIDGDGVDDFVAGAPNFDTAAHIYAGAAYVFSGKTGAILFTWIGDEDSLGLGVSTSFVGDADGDGVPDVAVGGLTDWIVHRDRGAVFLYSGKTGLLLQEWRGTVDHGRFGYGLAAMGDLNGDGCADLAIGSFVGATDVYLYSGKDSTLIDTMHGGNVKNLFGQELANAGDMDGDGFQELLIGAPQDDELYVDGGAVYIFSGRTRRQLTKIDAEGAPGLLGGSLAGGQDVDGDGIPDLLAGAQWAPKGRAYLFSGNDLFLQAEPPNPWPGANLTLSTRAAVPGSLALLSLEEIDGTPWFQVLQVATLDGNGEWNLFLKGPSGLAGHEIALRSYAQRDPTLGGVLATDLTYLWFQ
jgi:hypothetical protein